MGLIFIFKALNRLGLKGGADHLTPSGRREPVRSPDFTGDFAQPSRAVSRAVHGFAGRPGQETGDRRQEMGDGRDA